MNFTSADDVRMVQKALPFSRADAEEFGKAVTLEGYAALDRLEARIAELERERDDLEEIIESRDMRIKELGDALASLTVREIHAQRRVRELEAAVDLAIAMQNERVDDLDRANARIRPLEEALRHIAAIDCCATWYDNPSAGCRLRKSQAIARATLQREEET